MVAFGTPAVADDVPRLRDSVDDGVAGLPASAGEPEDLARKALELLTDPVAYDEVCRRATAWAHHFSWNETAQRLLEVVAPSER